MAAEVSNPAVMIVDPARTKVAGAIKQAAGQTGTSFQYLLATAKMESDFNPSAQATTSSAQGLFQFIEQTWLGTVKEAGAQFGYGQYADAITRSASGSYSVSDPSARTAIMNLRNDPVVSSAMAGVLTQSNSFKLTGEIGRRPSDAELYMAHFMGVAGAAKLINAAGDTPNVAGAALFPAAAGANQSIFYDRSGNARSVSEVYSNLASRYEAAANSPATQSAIASVAGLPVTLASAAPPPAAVDNAAYLASFPDVRNVTPAQAGDATRTATAQRGSEPMFRSLFLGGDRTEPVSPAVQSLWTSPSQAAMPSQTAMPELSRTPEVRPPTPLDLFSDRSGTFAS
ncbi:transglycosylase-like protein with SLT domain [Rhodopseudomonas thermotolerans]|uniref:Transglycosylase-like protein with SLT domain n=2 Tax=Rhodopseudomonas TaxID=1073 RepID=A0A336JHS1_9BRAD|nr:MULTISPECIES: transglycosylase SLT domain-containing protein [Rhodopseudomonas]RED41968.1 transglycosylase-like protein with SLT domain [Rhodopseudomonas pentothenatexigens]REG07429.1 transglycosylase-like protein with SLT domain [Rhodopseudomonas thermotolerans]SSW89328.1 transglycosylase-like protein with SLT domain [Rhodopseudomonas pentothenatexigens]